MVNNLGKSVPEKRLTARQLAELEAAVSRNPEDTETRRRLVRYYDGYLVKTTPDKEAERTKHRLWFVENRPEMSDYDVLGRVDWTKAADKTEYKTLKAAWLKQVAANPKNAQIRLNAAEFIRHSEAEIAEKLLLEGESLNPENYEIPLSLNRIYRNAADDSGNADKPESVMENRRKEFESGEAALVLLKQERSEERTENRFELLKTLSKTAYLVGRFDRAKQLATELVLDFGQNARAAGFETATHTGNIVLGLVALHENDVPKAKEYLLIAIRAPLRDERSYLSKIDTELAKKLFEKGEKSVVTEYLKLAEGLGNLKNYPDLYGGETKALKLWQQQIETGKTPSFDFDKP